MNGPTDSECNIPQTPLMFSDLKEPFWTLDITPESLPAKERALICRARLLNQIFRGANESDDRRAAYKSVKVYNSPESDDHHIFEWEGFIGPDMLTISWINRVEGDYVVVGECDEPYASEVLKAVYERYFPLDGLKCIFISGVDIDDTKLCLNLYFSSDNESSFRQSWDNPSAELDGIMGTKIGRTVGYFMLGAFGQGVKRVSKVTAISEAGQTGWDLQFDIENIDK